GGHTGAAAQAGYGDELGFVTEIDAFEIADQAVTQRLVEGFDFGQSLGRILCVRGGQRRGWRRFGAGKRRRRHRGAGGRRGGSRQGLLLAGWAAVQTELRDGDEERGSQRALNLTG